MTFAQPFSDYEVLDRVGAGSMGTVFRAHHRRLNRIVALKVLKPSLARDARYVDRLRREAHIVASLNHPNIVTGFDLGQEGGYHFFVMEFVEGRSLKELLNEWGIFSEERTLDVAIQITTALDHAFRKGVIHRDIKPANILIDNDNVVKLTDMGLAKGPDNLTITRDGATVGTPQYISPEQAKSPQDVDVRSDLYSLGATLFHMCTGQPPFRAQTMASVLVKVMNERAPSASGFNPDLSDGLNLIIRKLLSKGPEKRYQTPAELLADLERVRRSEAPDVDVEELDSGEEPPRRTGALVATVVAVLLIAFGVWYLQRDDGAEPQPEIDPRAGYREQVARELRPLETIGQRLARVKELAIGNVEPYKLEVLDSLRERWEENLADELPEVFRGQFATFADLDWARPEEQLKRELASSIKQELGIEADDLPRAAQVEYSKGFSELVRSARSFLQRREADFQSAVTARTREILGTVDEALRGGSVPEAENRLRELLRGYDGLEGSPPVSQLPPHLKLLVESNRRDAEIRGRGKIDRGEQEMLRDFAAAMQDLDRITALQDPIQAERQLTAFELDLADDYPPSNFRTSSDPWKVAGRQLTQARAKILAAKEAVSRASFDDVVQSAYTIAANGDIEEARATLRTLAAKDDPRVARHLELLDHVTEVQSKLFRSILRTANVRSRIKNVRMRDGSKAAGVELVRAKDGIVLQVAGEPAPLALLDVTDLVRVAGDGFESGLTAGERAGLAVWFLFSGKPRNALIASTKYEDLFRDHLLRHEFEVRPSESLVARGLFRDVRVHIANGRFEPAASTLGKLRGNHPKFAAAHKTELAGYATRIATGQAQAALVARLQRHRKPGMTIDVKDDMSITVVHDIRKMRIPELDRRGWVHEPGRPVRFESESVTLETARDQALAMASLLDVEAPVTMTAELEFADEKDVPRLLFIDCHGATLGLGLHRNGVVIGFPVDRGLGSKTLDVQSEVRRAMQQAAEAPRFVVAGARHRFRFVLRKKRGAQNVYVVRVYVDADEREVAEFDVLRVENPTAGLRITPLAPITVHSVEFRGTG